MFGSALFFCGSSTIFYKNFTESTFCGTIEKIRTERRRTVVMRILLSIWSWIFALFCLCVLPVYGLFSVTGFLGLVIGILALPVSPIKKLWHKILPQGTPPFAKPLLLFAAFCVMLAAAPPQYLPPPDLSGSAAQEAKEALIPVPTQNVFLQPQATVTPAESSVSAQDTKEQASASESEEEASPSPAPGDTVYIAGSGKGSRYHSSSTCSSMKDPIALTQEEAQAQGYTPCQRCYG